MVTRKSIFILSIIVAVLLLSKELLFIATSFWNETISFFGAESIGGATFLFYIKTILTVLMLLYLFVGFGGLFQSPLLSIISVAGDVLEEKKNNLSKKDVVALYLSIFIVYLTIIFFTKYLVSTFSLENSFTIYGLIFQILSIAFYFGLSHFSLNIVRSVSMNFLQRNEGFIKITTFSILYLCLIGMFMNIFSFVVVFLEKIITKFIN